jgi:hypothetical protein
MPVESRPHSFFFEFGLFLALFQRAVAAWRALSLRWLFVIAFDRARPPTFPAFRAISLRFSRVSEAARAFASATACGFFLPIVFAIFKNVRRKVPETDKPGCQITAPAIIPAREVPSLEPFLRRANSYAYQGRSANTLRGYKADWRSFSRFSEKLGVEPMPARPDMVASYWGACADAQLTAGTIQRRVSAITAAHTAAGFDSPTSSAAVKLCLAGIRRVIGTRQTGKESGNHD